MKNKRPRTAFTFIELSIVLALIAFIAITVSNGSSMITSSRLSAARAATLNSPVREISGLCLWLEATLKDSFLVSERDSISGTISTWYDQNPQSDYKNNAIQLTATNQAIYKPNGINGLPALQFDGVDNYYSVNRVIENDWTIFIVFNYISGGSGNSQWWQGAGLFDGEIGGGSNDFGLSVGTNATIMAGVGGTSDTTILSTLAVNKPYVVSYKRQSSDGAMNLYVNGTSVASTNGPIGQKNGPPILRIGALQSLTASNYLNGFIGEIIAYDRILSDFERNDIENYLSKKWRIKFY